MPQQLKSIEHSRSTTNLENLLRKNDENYYWRFQHANAHARKVKEYFRKNTQKGYENLIFLLDDGLFCQQLW